MDHQFVRHFIATLAYRTTKVIQNVLDHYPALNVGGGVRTPIEILHHMSNVLLFAYGALQPSERLQIALADWETEVERFYDILSRLDEAVIQVSSLHRLTWEQLLQGPLSDAMTHVGQLAMLRRLAGDPIPGENFSRADIRIGQIRSL